ncbi:MULTISPECIES: trypsin-like serine protease [Actinomycetes]|uniref:trypsin-like serine protease n=1 Tax=Actinomycetes TaxID=1760 RepID=UPI0001B58068|nr:MULTISPECIES: trypsin-like serine protease [Actinomycetes]
MAVAGAAALCGAAPASAIVGGSESARPYSFLTSFQLLMPSGKERRTDSLHKCTAALVAPQWVLTAAHCLFNGGAPEDVLAGSPQGWKVRVGSLDTNTGGELAAVDKYYTRGLPSEPYKDVALLHLASAVRAEPAPLAAAEPAVGTPVRIAGWGSTCAGGDDRVPQCYPSRLREADTTVQPGSACDAPDLRPGDGKLCVGSPDGSVRPSDMDSGGPLLVRQGGQWAVAGTVSSGNADRASFYTDTFPHLAWIKGIVNGTDVPPDPPAPNREGAINLAGCNGSVVRAPGGRAEDPALLLTNGHCVPTSPPAAEGKRIFEKDGQRGLDEYRREQLPAPGAALVDRPADRSLVISDRQGYPVAPARANRLVYATMTGTDVALYRLDKTYAQVSALGGKVFDLSTAPMRAGDRLTLATISARTDCAAAAVVPTLREGGYQQADSVRYDTCKSSHGDSGAPLLAPDGHTVVGVNNTHNDDGVAPNSPGGTKTAATPCSDNNPCEVGPDGTVTSRAGASYGQQVNGLAACLTAGSKLDLSKPGCAVTGAGVAVTSPAQGTTVQPGAAVTGHAAAGARVNVAVDGAPASEAVASPDGSWRTTLPLDLAPGRHRLTATVAGPAGQQTRTSKPVEFTLTPAGASALKAEQTFVPDAEAGTQAVLTVSFAAPSGMPVSTDAEQRFVAPAGFRFTGVATHILDTGGAGSDLRARVDDEGRVLVVTDPIRLNLGGTNTGRIDHRTLQMTVTADKTAVGTHADGRVTVGRDVSAPLSGKVHTKEPGAAQG